MLERSRPMRWSRNRPMPQAVGLAAADFPVAISIARCRLPARIPTSPVRTDCALAVYNLGGWLRKRLSWETTLAESDWSLYPHRRLMPGQYGNGLRTH